jgi:hypothetical protein
MKRPSGENRACNLWNWLARSRTRLALVSRERQKPQVILTRKAAVKQPAPVRGPIIGKFRLAGLEQLISAARTRVDADTGARSS